MQSQLPRIFISIFILTIFTLLAACTYIIDVEPELEKLLDAGGKFRKPPVVEPVLTSEGFSVYDDVQPPYYGADPDKTVVLVNNQAAKDPTWQELEEFLRSDMTDENDYLPGLRVCAEFAAELHNNAEKAGIRASWIAVEFEDDSIGHALNAFETTNAGLVFIDSTGRIPIVRALTISEDTMTVTEETECSISNDKKAYVQIGREMGFIGLDVLSDTEYEAYSDYINNWTILEAKIEAVTQAGNEYGAKLEAYQQQVEEYDRIIDEYESMLGGRTIIEDEAEYQKLTAMYSQLEQVRLELEHVWLALEQERIELNAEIYQNNTEIGTLGSCRREPLGIVKGVEIYW